MFAKLTKALVAALVLAGVRSPPERTSESKDTGNFVILMPF